MNGLSCRLEEAAGRPLDLPQTFPRNRDCHRDSIPFETEARELPGWSERAFRSLEIKPHLALEQIHSDCHAPREPSAILMENQKIVNIDYTPYAQLLKQSHNGAEHLGTKAGGLGHTEADCRPLQALASRGMTEPAVLAL
jgi:hypothetical protein